MRRLLLILAIGLFSPPSAAQEDDGDSTKKETPEPIFDGNPFLSTYTKEGAIEFSSGLFEDDGQVAGGFSGGVGCFERDPDQC